MPGLTSVFFAALFCLGVWAVDGAARPVADYRSSAELDADGAIWNVVILPNGTRLAGADKLLVNEGSAWSAVSVPGAIAWRGLAVERHRLPEETGAAAGTRVWAGAIGDLGYLERTRAGAWEWHSLRREFERTVPLPLDEIWHVESTEFGVVFVMSQQVVRWDGRRFQAWPLPAEPRLIALSAGDRLFLYQAGVGLLSLERDGPRLRVADRDLPGRPLLWGAVPAAANDLLNEGVVVGTGQGIFIRNSESWRALPRLGATVATLASSSAAFSAEGTLAIGTLLGGVVLADPATDTVRGRLNRASGLLDDSVYRLHWDAGETLWLALSRGLARARSWDHAWLLNERNGLDASPQALLRHGDDLFAVSDRAVQRFPDSWPGDPRVETLPEIDGLLSAAATLGPNLFVAGFGGIWRLDRERKDWVREHATSGDVLALGPSRQRSGWIYFVHGRRLMALEARAAALERAARNDEIVSAAEATRWIPRDLDADIADTPLSLHESADGLLWVSTLRGAVHAYRLVDRGGRAPRLEHRHTLGPRGTAYAALSRPHLTSLDERVCVVSESGIFVFDSALARFEKRPEFDPWVVLGAAAAPGRAEGYWLMRDRAGGAGAPVFVARVRWSEDKARGDIQPLDAPGLGEIGAAQRIFATPGDGETHVWVAGPAGTLRLRAERLGKLPSPGLVQWRGWVVGGEAQPLAESPLRLRANPGTLRVTFFSSESTEGLRYQSRLEGAEASWSALSAAEFRELTGLGPGRYVLHVRAVDAAGRAGPAIRREFYIAAPWWRTWLALLVYVIALAGAGLLIHRGRVVRLERQNLRLNHLVEERTRELALANAAKAEFLESISHEIRNPLNGVVGLVSMLREVSLDERGRSLAASLSSCARTLNRVFDEVLGFSKLESGQIGLHVGVFSPAALLDEVHGVFAATAQLRGNALSVRWESPAPPALRGDEEKIRTIVSNLMGNALKYAPGTPVRVSAQAVASAGGRTELTINVTDGGPGIPANEQELIFRKFVRGSKAKERSVPGTGLGLAACKALAELMGGFVGVESPAASLPAASRPPHGGPGATFYLRVWLDAADPAEVRQDLPAVPAPIIAVPGECVLIVEDEEYNQVVGKRVVEKLGFTAVVAPDASTALREFAAGSFSVVLLDWELGGVKGHEVAREIRRRAGGETPVILATTAHDSEKVRAECRNAGMDDFALKPLDPAQIAQLILEARAFRQGNGAIDRETLDVRAFALIGEEDGADMRTAAQQWIATLDRHLAGLRSDLGENRSGHAARTAHKLRAHGALIGAHPLTRAAAAMQEALDQAPPGAEESVRLLGVIESAAADARDRVARWITERANEPRG
ncbi:MAG: ATP-binding protein [Candidatus Didemnitutus sp.]|nr:ATP-binding protein [Candidatus Didemnitutus sp.]